MPPDFVGRWAGRRDYAKSLLHDAGIHGRVRQLAQFIADITYSVGTLSDRPIDQFVSYYPYADVGILLRFMKSCPKSDFRSQIRRAAEGTYLMFLALDEFEHMSRNGREKNFKDSLNQTVVDKRLNKLAEAIRVCDNLLDLVGGQPGDLSISRSDSAVSTGPLQWISSIAIPRRNGVSEDDPHFRVLFHRTSSSRRRDSKSHESGRSAKRRGVFS